MAKFAETVAKIRSPYPSILEFLEALNRQVSLGSLPIDANGTVYGTLTARRRGFKPFIVGLIPPDVPVNFLPVDPVPGKILKPAVSSNGIADVKASWRTSPGGEVKKEMKQFTSKALREGLFNAYRNLVGRVPDERTLALMYAQIMVETGKTPASRNLAAPNFNLGSSHVTTMSGHRRGRFLNDDAKKGIPDPIDKDQFVPPSNAYSYFIGVDHDKSSAVGTNDGRPFQVAFNAFKSLDEGVQFQARILLSGWKGTQTATSVDEFIAATEPIDGPRYNPHDPKSDPNAKGRSGYFGAWSEQYKAGMEIHYAAYFEQFPDPMGTGTGTGGVAIETESFGPAPLVMENNTSTTAESDDPLGNRLGRNIRIGDISRQQVANEQTSELRRQIEVLRAMPPLLMLINPSDFTRKYESSHDDGSKGRYGNIVHKWLERPMVISSSGVTAGQYVVNAEGAGGITNGLRTSSLSYMNLMSLVGLYRNNGVLYGGGSNDRGIPIVSCSVYIYYDQHVYLGSFDDFSVQDSADKPHNMSYSFGFTCRYDLDLADQNFVLDSAIG